MAAKWVLPVLLVTAAFHAPGQESGPGSTVGEQPYLVGPGEQLSVQVADVEEFDGKTIRVDESGNITLPLMGRMEASGLTVKELEAAIAARLAKYVVKPVVSVSIVERRTQPVTVTGAVRTPGILRIPEGKTLYEVLAMAGGALPDAGYRVRVTRRVAAGPIPVTGAHEDVSGQYFVADIPLKNLELGGSADNISILPNDFISVPRAEEIYVIGDVQKKGAFALADGQTVSVLQAIGMAEGTLRTAAPSKASIKRRTGEDKVVDIPVDIDKIMAGKAPDVKLQAKDILVVPGSASKSALERTITTILAIGTGAAMRF
jgi:polysaccharide export outer membrane protein